MPLLLSAETAWTCGSSEANTGQVSGDRGSAGSAASITAAAACCHAAG